MWHSRQTPQSGKGKVCVCVWDGTGASYVSLGSGAVSNLASGLRWVKIHCCFLRNTWFCSWLVIKSFKIKGPNKNRCPSALSDVVRHATRPLSPYFDNLNDPVPHPMPAVPCTHHHHPKLQGLSTYSVTGRNYSKNFKCLNQFETLTEHHHQLNFFKIERWPVTTSHQSGNCASVR